MLFRPDVKPLLTHADRFVRHAAARYFQYNGWDDPELLSLVLEACRLYGTKDNYGPLRYAESFPLTERTLPELLALLPSASDRDRLDQLNEILKGASPELFTRFEDTLAVSTGVRVETLERLERDRALSLLPTEQLWRELQELNERGADEDVEELTGRGMDLVKALTSRETPDAAEIVSRLQSYSDESGDWLETFLIQLAGERRLKVAVPELVRRFHFDTDFLLEDCQTALIQIGDPSAVELIRRDFKEASFGFRLSASDVLEGIKDPASEEALLELHAAEREIEISTFLCAHLCHLFSARGFDVVRQQIRDGYDRMGARLEDDLLVVADVLGIDLPEAPVWREEREAAEREYEQQAREMSSMFEPVVGGGQKSKAPPAAPRLETADEPIVRSTPHVGRNELCPCGSGKKFKKCCGSKARS